MTEIISTIAKALPALVTAGATIVLAIITWRYAETTDKILRAANKPEVAVYLYPDEKYLNRIYLHIENIGTGVASNVRFIGDFSSDPPIGLSFTPLPKDPILKTGLTT